MIFAKLNLQCYRNINPVYQLQKTSMIYMN